MSEEVFFLCFPFGRCVMIIVKVIWKDPRQINKQNFIIFCRGNYFSSQKGFSFLFWINSSSSISFSSSLIGGFTSIYITSIKSAQVYPRPYWAFLFNTKYRYAILMKFMVSWKVSSSLIFTDLFISSLSKS